jgi:hypothetical protein
MGQGRLQTILMQLVPLTDKEIKIQRGGEGYRELVLTAAPGRSCSES